MQSFFYHVLNDEGVYAKINREIEEATKTGKLPHLVSFEDAQQLPYFQAALKEAMRVRPAVGLNIGRLAPPGGANLDGQKFPEGTRLAVNGWVLHRDRGVFGQDADIYRPERWLSSDDKTIKLMDRHMFQVSQFLCQLEDSAVVIDAGCSSEAAVIFALAKTLLF